MVPETAGLDMIISPSYWLSSRLDQVWGTSRFSSWARTLLTRKPTMVMPLENQKPSSSK